MFNQHLQQPSLLGDNSQLLLQQQSTLQSQLQEEKMLQQRQHQLQPNMFQFDQGLQKPNQFMPTLPTNFQMNQQPSFQPQMQMPEQRPLQD